MNKKKQVVVSIVCDVFNHSHYLRDCLDGFIKQQTSFPFELLIHDDASTDNSQKIINEYVSKYPDIIKFISQKNNQYSQDVRIWGTYQFPRARGKYIALCEGDDYWTDPYKLQKQVDFMEANPDYSMCFHSATEMFERHSDKNRLFSKIDDREYTALEIYNHWIIPTASVLFKKDVVDSELYMNNIAYNPSIVFVDIALFISCSTIGKVYGFSDVMSVYRRHASGMTNQLVHFSLEFKYCSQGFAMASIFTSNKKLCNLMIEKSIKRTLTMYWKTVLTSDTEYRSKSYLLLKQNFKKRPFLILVQSLIRFYMALRTLYRNKNRRKI